MSFVKINSSYNQSILPSNLFHFKLQDAFLRRDIASVAAAEALEEALVTESVIRNLRYKFLLFGSNSNQSLYNFVVSNRFFFFGLLVNFHLQHVFQSLFNIES